MSRSANPWTTPSRRCERRPPPSALGLRRPRRDGALLSGPAGERARRRLACSGAAGLAWTERGIALARSGDGSARYWLGPLLNNLGWDQFDSASRNRTRDVPARARRAGTRPRESGRSRDSPLRGRQGTARARPLRRGRRRARAGRCVDEGRRPAGRLVPRRAGRELRRSRAHAAGSCTRGAGPVAARRGRSHARVGFGARCTGSVSSRPARAIEEERDGTSGRGRGRTGS